MQCDDVKRYLSPYIDNELESHINIAIEEHLEGCHSCRDLFNAEHRWEQSLKANLISSKETQQKWYRALNHFNGKPSSRRFLIPATVSLAVVAAVFFINYLSYTQRYDLARAALLNHNKYVEDLLPLETFAQSPSVIEKYFKNKLPYAVTLPLADTNKSVEFVGARRCHLKEVPVAFLVYSVEQEPVSVFLIDSAQAKHFTQFEEIFDNAAIDQKMMDGKNVVVKSSKEGVVVAAVAKLPDETLNRFVELF